MLKRSKMKKTFLRHCTEETRDARNITCHLVRQAKRNFVMQGAWQGLKYSGETKRLVLLLVTLNHVSTPDLVHHRFWKRLQPIKSTTISLTQSKTLNKASKC